MYYAYIQKKCPKITPKFSFLRVDDDEVERKIKQTLALEKVKAELKLQESDINHKKTKLHQWNLN